MKDKNDLILLIDNYDSFVFNLEQYIGEVTSESREIQVIRNDKIGLYEIESLHPAHIVLSPGPCTPNEAGICLDLVSRFAGKIPILGVCLGHQAIAQSFGGRIIRAKNIFHGKTSLIEHNESGIFQGIPNNFQATRYHSLVVEKETLPDCFVPTASSPDGEIMGIVHKEFHNLIGLQFHPESILTDVGKNLLRNFLGCASTATTWPYPNCHCKTTKQ